LGIDVYDNNKAFISSQSTPTMSSIYIDPSQFGPQFLVDGVHEMINKTSSSIRIPRTNVGRNEFMQLAFASDTLISSVKIWNVVGPDQDQILGCTLSIINNAGVTLYSQNITTLQDMYNWIFISTA